MSISLPNSWVASVVGITFRPSFPINVIGLQPGDTFNLEAEPDNQYDPYAIKVTHPQRGHLGYLPRDLAFRLHHPSIDVSAMAAVLEDGPGPIVSKDGEIYFLRIRVTQQSGTPNGQ